MANLELKCQKCGKIGHYPDKLSAFKSGWNIITVGINTYCTCDQCPSPPEVGGTATTEKSSSRLNGLR